VCGAHRIGHGTRLREDGGLLNYVNDHRIPLEICISSNVQTKACASFDTHPVRSYFDYGLRTTICTDNRTITDTTVTDELMILVDHYGFTLPELRSITINGFKSAFMPYRKKREVMKMALAEFDRVVAEYRAPKKSKKAVKATA
jgi:adenosine deaminase